MAERTIAEQIDDALERGDAGKLDLALRAEYHYKHRGSEVSTIGMQFDLVKTLDPTFYQYF